jgi:hypothetical protein
MFKAKISHFFIMRANDHRVLDCVCLRQKLVISLNRQKSLHFLIVMAPNKSYFSNGFIKPIKRL